ncbi:MAG: cysteine desulfurase, partial [Methanococcaceae archaeon]
MNDILQPGVLLMVDNREKYFSNKIRLDFPILQRFVHNKPIIYLDNAATTQKPRCVIRAEASFYEHLNSNIHRGVHYLSEQATLAYEMARQTMKQHLNAESTHEIIFVKGATEAINLVAYSYGRPNISEGDEVIISAMEHHANIIPWQIVCQEKKAKLRVIPMSASGELLIDELDNLINERTRFISVVHVSNSLGTINQVEEIINKAHRHNIPVLVDGSQAVPHMKIDVQEMGCDFYVFSGHKLYGPTGIGVLYGKENLLEKMPPYQTGGDMIERVTFEKTTFNVLPYKFEAGTQNIAGVIGLENAIKYVNDISLEKIQAYEALLTEYATKELQQIDQLKIIGTAPNKAPVISFILENIHPHDIGTLLDNEGIAIRTGHHCTQPVMDFFKVPATARVSLAMYNTKEEIDKLVIAIKQIVTSDRRKIVNYQGDDNWAEQDLYQSIISTHNEKPSNFHDCSECNHTEEG